MRGLVLSSILVASAGVAAADPAPAPSCTVNIAHAPDDVRSVVETWVRVETRCHGDLEVRIVPTDGGYYLFARDTSGRVRERVVPDAQSAGVLVASWAADDQVEAPPPPPPPATLPAQAPGLVRPIESLGVVAPSERHVMLGLGAMVGNVYGLRAELDMTRYRDFVFGLSVGGTTASVETGNGPLTMRDLSVMGYVALMFQSGRLWFRPQVGLGGITSEFNKFTSTTMEATGGDQAAMFEASARVGADLGSWTVSAGPVARMYTETWDSSLFGTLLNRNGDVSVYLGVGRRL